MTGAVPVTGLAADQPPPPDRHSTARHVCQWTKVQSFLDVRRARVPVGRATIRGMDCKHPPARLYAWRAYDGTLCVACCKCGAVLKGAA